VATVRSTGSEHRAQRFDAAGISPPQRTQIIDRPTRNAGGRPHDSTRAAGSRAHLGLGRGYRRVVSFRRVLIPDRVSILAADPRWQWKEWCDARECARSDFRGEARRLRRSCAAASSIGLRSSSSVRGRSTNNARPRSLPWPCATAGGSERQQKGRGVSARLVKRPVDGTLCQSDDPPSTGSRRSPLQRADRKVDAQQVWCDCGCKPLIVEVLVPVSKSRTRSSTPQRLYRSRRPWFARVTGAPFGQRCCKIEGTSTNG